MRQFLFLFFLFTIANTKGQLNDGVYTAEVKNNNLVTTHELKINESYMVYTVYDASPALFHLTLGGFYTIDNKILTVALEFNSEFDKNGVKTVEWPIELGENALAITMDSPIEFKKMPIVEQPLDGKWLFATRGPDNGQDRRGENNARKTLKFLIDGHFQWIAYHTETFKFSGTGGGEYNAKNGLYKEHISFFSRDNNRVGADLEFTYERMGSDWHHKGNNSKGEPMYEIWSLRK